MSFLWLSLDPFAELIQEVKRHTQNPVTHQNADLNLGFIADVDRKLQNKEHGFTLDEVKVMYLAVRNRRDFINSELDAGFDNEDDRLDALECLRVANSLLRKIKAFFAGQGVDIDAFISQREPGL